MQLASICLILNKIDHLIIQLCLVNDLYQDVVVTRSCLVPTCEFKFLPIYKRVFAVKMNFNPRPKVVNFRLVVTFESVIIARTSYGVMALVP